LTARRTKTPARPSCAGGLLSNDGGLLHVASQHRWVERFARERTVLEVYEPANLPGKLKPVGGSMSDDLEQRRSDVNALWRASCVFRPSPSEGGSCARAGRL
jgi:hypothetical protein